jgi:hypothetical protein
MTWPPDYAAARAERLKRLRAIRRDPKVLAAALIYYRTRPVEFIEHWCITFDPRRDGAKTIPFVLFPKQREFVEWLVERYTKREDGVVEKARDMGATWLCCAVAVWLWLFHPGVKVAFGSRKEDLVDKLGDPDSIFEKLRLLLRHLPPELLPKGFRHADHDHFLKLVQPVNGATITGEAGDNIGRGGRSSVYILDEAAHIERPERVDAALDDNSDCKIYVSTPHGMGNPFARKRHGGKYPVFTFRWRDHPAKTQDWYNAEKAKRDPVNMAQEVDLDYEASVENICIPATWVAACRGWSGIKRRGVRVAGLDVGGGADLSVFVVRQGPHVDMPVSWNDPDTINTANYAAALMDKQRAAALNYDVYGIGTGVMAQLKRLPKVRSRGINTGQPPTESKWLDGKTGREKFVNLKAELWWILRDRAYKTFMHLLWVTGEGGAQYPEDELLLLPDHEALCRELSTPRWFTTPAGKIQIESKDELKKRGVKSPDFADAVALAFAPISGQVRATEISGLI